MHEPYFYAKTGQIFQLFTGLSSIGAWEELITEAVGAVQGACRENADKNDLRLCYYAAALANLRYRQILGARGATEPTYAGQIPQKRDDRGTCTLAQALVTEYRKAAAPLLRDGGFVFLGVR